MKYISVAVDGPAGAGKSSVSKIRVQCIVRLHFLLLTTE